MFELWCWRRLLRVPWTVRRSNQSILKEVSPEYSLEGLMLKLKLQYFATWCKELTHLKRPWCWERLKPGEGNDRRWNGWMTSLTQWMWVWASSVSLWWTWKPGMLQSKEWTRVVCWGRKKLDATQWLNWTEFIYSDKGIHWILNYEVQGIFSINHLTFLSVSTHLPTLSWNPFLGFMALLHCVFSGIY